MRRSRGRELEVRREKEGRRLPMRFGASSRSLQVSRDLRNLDLGETKVLYPYRESMYRGLSMVKAGSREKIEWAQVKGGGPR